MKAEKKLFDKLEAEQKGIHPDDKAALYTVVPNHRNISCNVEECYFESYGACLANQVMITPQGCITDRNLLEDI
jgi:hypothetical protein